MSNGVFYWYYYTYRVGPHNVPIWGKKNVVFLCLKYNNITLSDEQYSVYSDVANKHDMAKHAVQ